MLCASGYTHAKMETSVYLSEELLARLERLASHRQTDTNVLLSEAIVGYLEQEETQIVSADTLSALSSDDINAVNEGIDDMEAGRTLPFADYVKERVAARAARQAGKAAPPR